MTRTRRKPLTAADARRMGGQPLGLLVRRDWADYARHQTAHGATLDALYAALREPGDSVTVRLSESDTRALVAACEAGGRTRTAEAIRAAVKAATAPAEKFDAMAHLESLVAEGVLEADEVEAFKRINGGGLF